MDTKFWGPSGWRLLHFITFRADMLDKKAVHTFFTNLPYVLPCKFCRASLTDYYTADPVPSDPKQMPHWLYRIHNCVNDKLRQQRLLETPNPQWQEVKKKYSAWVNTSCSRQRMIGWDFLFSVAYTTPCRVVGTSPMPNAPPLESLQSPELRNRWGLMTRDERIPYFEKWWDVLPQVLPYKEWRDAWAQVVPKTPSLKEGRAKITAWLFKAEKAMCAKMQEDAPHDSFNQLCSELQTFASGCGNNRSTKMKTCRSKNGRHTLKKRRERMYVATGGYL